MKIKFKKFDIKVDEQMDEQTYRQTDVINTIYPHHQQNVWGEGGGGRGVTKKT